MKKQCLIILLFSTLYSSIIAQKGSLNINPGIVMLEDSLENKALLFSVNSFLASAHQNSQNKWILPTQNVGTQILIDEIQDIQKNEELENNSFFKPYLTNIIPLEDGKYAVHIAYIGINNETAILRANFELIAHKTNDTFLISSPLERNTQNWKTKEFKNHIFHYPFALKSDKVQNYYDLISLFDKKLNNTEGESHYYLCDDEIHPLKLFGVDYKSDYNGERINRAESSIDNTSLYVMDANRFYNYPEHDLWHFRLRQVIPRKNVHRRVDCHIATLYGGLWGISWEELFPLFTEKYVVGKNVDWLEHKKNKSHFITNGRRKNYTDDFVGALLIKKIEQEKGFDGVWKLLMTKRTKEEDEYFEVLENLTGISKKNYNQEVFKLIKKEMKRLDG